MISQQYKCIFIHIPKTGGTSIEQKLGLFDELKRGVQDHRTIHEIKNNLSYFEFKSYFKFTFVRNPWARIFSWYKNIMRDPIHRSNLKVAEECSFKDFLKRHINQHFLNAQLFWITDKRGKILVDFIGKFERLEEDFSHVCDILRIKDKMLPKLLISDDEHYTEKYDDEMKKMVAEKFIKEIQLFGYTF